MAAEEDGSAPAGAEALQEPGEDVGMVMRRAADFLSRTTGQLGFYVGLPADHLVLERIQFVRVSSERIMALLASRSGVANSTVSGCRPSL